MSLGDAAPERGPHRFAVAAVRAWARLYTALVPASVRLDRQDELTSDLHDHLADLRARRVRRLPASVEIGRRLIVGMPAELAWALTTMEENTMTHMRTLAVTGWAFALVASVVGLFTAVAGLAEGWRELPQHWWSMLAGASVAGAAVGLVLTILALTGRRAVGAS